MVFRLTILNGLVQASGLAVVGYFYFFNSPTAASAVFYLVLASGLTQFVAQPLINRMCSLNYVSPITLAVNCVLLIVTTTAFCILGGASLLIGIGMTAALYVVVVVQSLFIFHGKHEVACAYALGRNALLLALAVLLGEHVVGGWIGGLALYGIGGLAALTLNLRDFDLAPQLFVAEIKSTASETVKFAPLILYTAVEAVVARNLLNDMALVTYITYSRFALGLTNFLFSGVQQIVIEQNHPLRLLVSHVVSLRRTRALVGAMLVVVSLAFAVRPINYNTLIVLVVNAVIQNMTALAFRTRTTSVRRSTTSVIAYGLWIALSSALSTRFGYAINPAVIMLVGTAIVYFESAR